MPTYLSCSRLLSFRLRQYLNEIATALELTLALKGFDVQKESAVKKVVVSLRGLRPSEIIVKYSVVVPTQGKDYINQGRQCP